MRRGSLALAVLGACLVPVLGAAQAPARISCGEPDVFRARKDVNPGARAPLTVGDSVMSYALPNLAGIGYDADAQACRRLVHGVGLLRRLEAAGELPHFVVLALGTDGPVYRGRIDEALRILGPQRVLGLVTPRELGGGAGFDATVMRRAAEAEPRRIVLLDWVVYSRGHRGWFQPDKTHLNSRGAEAFARLHAMAVRWSVPGRFPDGVAYGSEPFDGVGAAGQTAICAGRRVTIAGTRRPDRLRGTRGPDVIAAGGGGDEILSLGGRDLLCGGPGADSLDAGPGNDLLYGARGGDSLRGGTGHDRMGGQAGADYLLGGRGNDLFAGGPDGGTPATADVASFGGLAPVNADISRGKASGAGADVLRDIEGLLGSIRPDVLTGDPAANALSGNGGEDLIRGGPGDDQIGGGGYPDMLYGGLGDDRVFGSGNDDEIHGEAGDDLLQGEPGDDRLAGGEGDDRLFGDSPPCDSPPCGEFAGDDLLDGGSGGETAGDRGDGGAHETADGCANLEQAVRCEGGLPPGAVALRPFF